MLAPSQSAPPSLPPSLPHAAPAGRHALHAGHHGGLASSPLPAQLVVPLSNGLVYAAAQHALQGKNGRRGPGEGEQLSA